MNHYTVVTPKGDCLQVVATSWRVEGDVLRFEGHEGVTVVCYSLHNILSWSADL